MGGLISKARTFLDYAKREAGIGANLRSTCLLASMLLRYKLRSILGLNGDNLYTVQIRFGKFQRSLHFRDQDIFIVHEVYAGNVYMFDALKEEPPGCIVDLGAHIGLATLRFKTAFPKAVIHCYEPDPDNFRLLELNTKGLDGVVLHQEAVGDVSGDAVFYVHPQRHTASTLKRGSQDEPVVESRCVVRSLDHILSQIGDVDLVKFDIEGSEYEVFSHSRNIHRVKLVVGEMKALPKELTRFLELFLSHEFQYRSVTSKMHLIALRRKPLTVVSAATTNDC